MKKILIGVCRTLRNTYKKRQILSNYSAVESKIRAFSYLQNFLCTEKSKFSIFQVTVRQTPIRNDTIWNEFIFKAGDFEENKKACDDGDAVRCGILATMYYDGKGVKQNYS